MFITEFMAANNKALADQDRQFSDWIELYNAGAESVNLAGWSLTDQRSDLAKWKFPAVTLASHNYLVVFASQKNRAQPGSELHTNFKLSADGDYLALVKPDGVTIASEFAPRFPAQYPDVSYGLAMNEQLLPLVASNTLKRILVPSAEMGLDWTQPGFDHGSWKTGFSGAGYAQGTNYLQFIGAGADLAQTMFGKNPSCYMRVPFVVEREAFDRLKLRLRYKDGFIAWLNGTEVARRNAPATPQWNSTATAAHGASMSGVLEEKFQSRDGAYTLSQIEPVTRSRLGLAGGGPEGSSYLRLANGRVSSQVNSIAFDQAVVGASETIQVEFDFRFKSFGESAAADSLACLLIPTATFGSKGGGAALERFQNNQPPNLPGVFAVRFQFFPQPNQNSLSLHWNGSEKMNLKMPIGSSQLSPRVFHHAHIRLKYVENGALVSLTLTPDAYGAVKKSYSILEEKLFTGLNPFESRVQFVSALGNIAGTIDLANVRCQFIPSAGLPSEEFDLSRFRKLLQPGPNLLAIQGLNLAVNEPDFLIAPELVAESSVVQTNSPLYFAVASPGAANGEGVPGVSTAPKFSEAGGIFAHDVSLELQTASASAVIRYTLDGSEPGLSSEPYSAPISIRGSTLVKAKTFELGLLPSPTVTETYTMVDQSLLNFNSDLPLVIINTFGQYVYYRGRNIPASFRFINAGKGRSNLAGSADFDGRGDIHVRGHSSLHLPKHSYTFHLRDESARKAKVSIFGLPKDSDWVLYAPFTDKTLLRDVLAYELSSKMGHYAARTKFVEVFMAHGGGKLTRGDYAGVYVLEEKIKRAKKRVNIAELTPGDNAEPEISGGYIFKRDHNDGNWGEPGFTTFRGCHYFFVEPKGREITPQQKSWLARYMNNFERALYGPNFANPSNGYAAYLDIDSFIDEHWLIELSKNIDGFRYSVFLQKDRGGKLKLEPVWDWNLSFGNADYYDGYDPTEWYTPVLRENEISWFRRLIQDPEFAQRYVDRWGELRAGLFAPSNILARVDQLAASLNEGQARNFQRWPIMGRTIKPNYFVGNTYQEEINWMKQWIERRIAWIDRQFLAPPVLSFKRGSSQAAETLTLRAQTGKIYYTLDGTDPRLPGGSISPKAQLYNSPIAVSAKAQLFARALNSTTWSSPIKTNPGMTTAANAKRLGLR